MMPSINTNIDNMINMRRAEIYAGRGSAGASKAAAEAQQKMRVGEAKIKAGKATTLFTSSPAGTRALAKEIVWEPTSPQDLPGQVKFLQEYVRRFDALMKENGFTPNDFSDGYAFAYALSYAAYHNRGMRKEDTLRFRDDNRQKLLKAAYFQGFSDTGKQYTYELNAFMAMQAMEWRMKANKAGSSSEKRSFEEKAQRFGEYVLKAQ